MTKMREIVAQVSNEYQIELQELLSPKRKQRVVVARQDAMWRMRQLKKDNGRNRYSYWQIANLFNKDHSTVMHGERQHKKRMEESSAYRTTAHAE